MFEEFSVGDTVIIKIDGSSIIGEIHLISKSGKRIILRNTRNLTKNVAYEGTLNFFSSEIRAIRLFESKQTEDKTNIKETENTDADKIKLFKNIGSDELNNIDLIINRSIYINQTDKSYHDAIKDLKSQSKVSLTIESASVGRNSLSAKIITFFSPVNKNLYIFDMQCLRKLYPELKNIFIHRQPIKIIYDGRYINDYLREAYDIELKGISDTFVGHLLLTKEKEEIKLDECFMKYFNLPKDYFQDQEDINWHERPLKSELRMLTAKKAVLIYLLHQTIFEEGLLKTYYDTCDSFSKIYSSNNDFVQVATKMSSGDVEALEKVIDTDVELSYELKDLKILKGKK